MREEHEDGPEPPTRKRLAKDKDLTLEIFGSKKGYNTLQTCGISFSHRNKYNGLMGGTLISKGSFPIMKADLWVKYSGSTQE